jgi:Helix-turn-helix domain
VPMLYRATLALAVHHHRDGLSSPAMLHTLRAELYRATMSQQRHQLAETLPAGSSRTCHDSAYVDSAAAAELLGLSRRSAQRLAANGLDAVRCGSIWLFDRGAVMALAERRKAAK